jgi:hypothetical protein
MPQEEEEEEGKARENERAKKLNTCFRYLNKI